MTDQSPSRMPSLPWLFRGSVIGFLLALILHAGYILLGSNFRTVLPDLVYRCAQPSPAQLESWSRRYGIRTIVNLRGCCPSGQWYRQEADATYSLGISQEDVSFSASRLPSTVAIAQLLEVLDRAEYPILLHCQQGADRTGLASVMVALTRTSLTLEQALGQLGPTSGHLPFGRTRYIDRFFALYEDWLTEQGAEHSPDRFRDWALNHYRADTGSATLALVEADANGRLQIKAGQDAALTVRCRNTSTGAWQLKAGTGVGHGVTLAVLDETHANRLNLRLGQFEQVVKPGEALELPFRLPALPAGRYELQLDLIDGQHARFSQLGNELLVIRLEVS